MAVTRNLKSEQLAIKSVMAGSGKLPDIYNDPAMRAQVYRIAYPPSAGGLPDELKGTVDESLYLGTGTPSQTSNVSTSSPINVPEGEKSNIGALAGNVETARGTVEGTYSATARNEYGRVLQDAIRRSTGYTAPQVKLGESELFKKAGVSGYNVLSQSLSSHANEMINSAGELSRIVNDLTGAYKASAEDATNKYKTAVDEYQFEADRLAKIAERAENYKQQIKLESLRYEHDKEIAKLKSEDDFDSNILANLLGLDSSMSSTESGIVDGFNISTYATDPLHEQKVKTIRDNMPTISSADDVDSYIQKNYPKSPITGEMVISASEKYKVPAETMLAMMEQDSSFGTLGMGAKTFNPGNIGNDDEGNIKNYGTWNAGVDAVGNWLNKHRVVGTPSTKAKEDLIQKAMIFNNVRLQIPTVSDKKSLEENFKVALQSGRIDLADQAIDDAVQTIILSKSPFKEDFAKFDSAQTVLTGVMGALDSLVARDISFGPWKKLREEVKPWLGMSKDQDYVSLSAFIETPQAEIRNKIYGASLTNNELANSSKFMITDGDDIKTVQTKTIIQLFHANLANELLKATVRGSQTRDAAKQEFSKSVSAALSNPEEFAKKYKTEIYKKLGIATTQAKSYVDSLNLPK